MVQISWSQVISTKPSPYTFRFEFRMQTHCPWKPLCGLGHQTRVRSMPTLWNQKYKQCLVWLNLWVLTILLPASNFILIFKSRTSGLWNCVVLDTNISEVNATFIFRGNIHFTYTHIKGFINTAKIKQHLNRREDWNHLGHVSVSERKCKMSTKHNCRQW